MAKKVVYLCDRPFVTYTLSQKKHNIFEVAFLLGEECIPVHLGQYMQISNDPGSRDPDPEPQEKSMKKSSFETECRWLLNVQECFTPFEKTNHVGIYFPDYVTSLLPDKWHYCILHSLKHFL